MNRRVFVVWLAAAALAAAVCFAVWGDALALPRDSYKPMPETVMAAAITGETQFGAEVWADTDVQALTLSQEGFFYDSDIMVEIKLDLDGVTEYAVYYTNDGSEPNRDAKPYTMPVVIRADTKRVKGYCLKARAYYIKDGVEYETPVITHTYFVSKTVDTRFNTLVFAVSANPDDLYGYDNGILVEGRLRDDFVKNNPTKEIIPTDPANYNLRGLAGERPAYVEVFEPDGTRVLAQGIGLRVQGGWSRATEQKSLRLLAKSMYDLDGQGKFHYTFFSGAASVTDFPAALAFDAFEQLTLRNHANDFRFAFVRNELSATLSKRAGFPDVSPVRAAAVFVNGEYYGFSWLYEGTGTDYLRQNYQANDDHFAILNLYEGDWGGGAEHDEGPPESKRDFEYAYGLCEQGMENDKVYEEFCSLVDIDNLTLYYAMQCYIDNRDWPGNNMKVWRYYGENGDNPYLDGKWRFIFYDNEFAWGLYGETVERNTLARLLGEVKQEMGGPSPLFTALMQRADYREKFLTTLCDVASGAFSYASVSETLEQLAAEQDHELNAAFKGLKDYSSYAGLEESRAEIKRYAKDRVGLMYGYMKKQYALSAVYRVTVTGAEGMVTKLNTLTADGAETISSRYFAEHGVTLSAYAKSAAYRFSHWVVNGQVVTEETVPITEDMAKAGDIEITLVADQKTISPLMITEAYPSGGSDWIKIYNPSSDPVSTEGLFLSDTMLNPQKWAFPVFTIEPYGETLLACQNTTDPSMLLQVQVSFNISEGEVLLLSDSEGITLSKALIPDMNSRQKLAYDFDDELYHVVPL